MKKTPSFGPLTFSDALGYLIHTGTYIYRQSWEDENVLSYDEVRINKGPIGSDVAEWEPTQPEILANDWFTVSR